MCVCECVRARVSVCTVLEWKEQLEKSEKEVTGMKKGKTAKLWKFEEK